MQCSVFTSNNSVIPRTQNTSADKKCTPIRFYALETSPNINFTAVDIDFLAIFQVVPNPHENTVIEGGGWGGGVG